MVALPLEAIVFGLAGLLEMLFMQQALLQNRAFQRSRRLGWVAIFVITSVLMSGSSYLTPESVLFKNRSIFYFCVFLFIACVSLSLCDDVSVGGLRPKFRLLALCSVYDTVY